MSRHVEARRPFDPALAVAVAVCLASAGTAAARVDLAVEAMNDVGTATAYPDDLYSSALGIEVATRSYGLRLYENMFTDREASTRFDEFHLNVSRDLPPAGGWRIGAELGVVRVGEGVFGQDFQNRVHRLIDTGEVSLDYIDETSWHGSARLTVQRPFALGGTLVAGPWFDLYEAVEFKRHAIAGGKLHWQATTRLAVFGHAAARYSGTDLAALDPWVDGWAPAGEIGVRFRDLLTASYSYNAFGTEDQHLHLQLRWRFD